MVPEAGFSWRRTAVVLLTVFGPLPGCTGERAENTATSVSGEAVRGATAEWQLLWRIGGSEADTLLAQPSRLVASGSLLYVLDLGRRSVTAIDRQSGALRWVFGSVGSGPGEIRLPQAAAALRNGNVAVFDAGNGRLVMLNESGSVVETVSTASVGQLHDFCEFRAGEFLGLIAAPTEPLVRFDGRGAVLSRERLPWSAAATLDPAAQTAHFARLSSQAGCVVASQTTPDWIVRTADGWSEPHRYSGVSEAPPGRTPPDLSSAVSVPDTGTVIIAVLPAEGQRAAPLRRFSLNGTDLGEWRLPTPPVNRIVWQDAIGDTVYVLHGMNQSPTVSAFVRTGPGQ